MIPRFLHSPAFPAAGNPVKEMTFPAQGQVGDFVDRFLGLGT